MSYITQYNKEASFQNNANISIISLIALVNPKMLVTPQNQDLQEAKGHKKSGSPMNVIIPSRTVYENIPLD